MITIIIYLTGFAVGSGCTLGVLGVQHRRPRMAAAGAITAAAGVLTFCAVVL